MNRSIGNLGYIGAVLTDEILEPDDIVEDFRCPDNCRICLDACPVKALDGTTVNQKLCRERSFLQNKRDFDIYGCNECRKRCPLRNGKH